MWQQHSPAVRVRLLSQAGSRSQPPIHEDPKHTKTLLNQGIVLAFGKQDLQGAEAAWRKVVELAPGTPEGEAAKRGLDGIASAHQRGAGTAPATNQ